MCIFCTAIPAVAALGAAAHGKQVESRRRNEESSSEPEPAPPTRLYTLRQWPIAGITGIVIAGLVVGSVLTHTTSTGG